jgi:hypothetical protein
MNYACDFDVFREWARAVTAARFDARIERKYNVATIYKRAQGEGTIRAVTGLDELYRRHGDAIAWNHLLPVGARRRNWRQTLVSDGFLLIRHPDLATTLAIADEIGERVRLYAS